MKPETGEWVFKAEGDYWTALRESRAVEASNPDAICFHAQQCAEKYLKARLVEAGTPFPRIHDLEALLNLTLPLEPAWEHLRNGLQELTDMAVEVRYPGFTAGSEEAVLALATAVAVREAVRAVFGLDK